MGTHSTAVLNARLFQLGAPKGLVRFGTPTLAELLERGLAVQAGGVEGGPILIPLDLRPRVSTQPGTMRKDNGAQRRAAQLDDAPSQELKLPRTRELGPQARAFNMRPQGLATRVYGQ